MTNFVVQIPSILQSFLNKFNGLFTKPTFLSFSIYLNGLFLELKRSSIQAISFRTFSATYEQLQYFLSEANWDIDQLNNNRIRILESNRTTKTLPEGVLIIDDSACKKYGTKTQGAKLQYYSLEDRKINCNVFVTSAYADKNKRFPINLLPYKPDNDFLFGKESIEFKSKIQLAEELVEDAVSKNIHFSDVIFDSWYFSKEFVSSLQEKNLTWISEAKDNRWVSYHDRWLRVDELVKFIPITKFRRIEVVTLNGDKRPFYIKSFTARLKGMKQKLLVVVCIGTWIENDPKDVRVLVTNHLAYSGEQVIQKYIYRWAIECLFRDIKDNFYFDHYQVRSLKAITRHWHLCCLAYTFLLICKLNGSFSRIFYHKPSSCGEQLELFRKINSIHHADWIKQNYETYQSYLGLKNYHRQSC